MDCQVALNILDSVSPSEDPNGNPDFREAVSHRNGCDACMETWQARKHFDQKIANSIIDIPVPGNLKEILLKQVSEQGKNSSNKIEPVQVPGSRSNRLPGSRRRLKQIAMTIGLCMVVGVSFLFWNQIQSNPDAISLVTIQAEVPNPLNSMNDFDDSFEASLPGKGWKDQAFTYTSQPKGFGLNNSGQHDRAIFGFELSLQNQSPVQGLLVIYSKSNVKNVPDKQNFDSSSVRYLNRGNSRFASVSWVSGDQVYVCYVYAGGVNNKETNGLNAIEAIERVVNLPTV